jgi:hypothetical protein
MTNGVQTELWLEGFVKRANDLGVTAREDVAQLIKIACRMSLMSDPAFQSGFKEAMEKKGFGYGMGDLLDALKFRGGSQHPGTYNMDVAQSPKGQSWFQKNIWRPSTMAKGREGLAAIQGAGTNPAYAKQLQGAMQGQQQLYEDAMKAHRGLQESIGGTGDFPNHFRDSAFSYGRYG